MNVFVLVNIDGQEHPITVSQSALDQVRARFNPSQLATVDHVKALFAACITTMEATRDGRGEAGRCAALAITNAETAAMYAVKALTTGV